MTKKPLTPHEDGWGNFVFFDGHDWYYRKITGQRQGPYATEKFAIEALQDYLHFMQSVDIANMNRVATEDILKKMRQNEEAEERRGIRTALPVNGLLSLPPLPVYGILDPNKKTDARLKFEADMNARIIGQERAIRTLSRVYEIAEAGISDPDRPLANLMFLGPTGVGKTRAVEAMAESLFGSRTAVVKISCAEFQHSHEIAKILGAPPGYVGFRESKQLISKDALEAGWGPDKPHISLVLFDEVEKSAPEMWQLLLGIMDKGVVTIGSNETISFARCIIFLTGNVGTSEMSSILSGGLGFSSGATGFEGSQDEQMYRVALAAAKRKFPPEFMNRLDKTVVFRTLTPEGLEKILDIEVQRLWSRVTRNGTVHTVLNLLPEARALLLREGTDPKFGARPLRRTVERYLLAPIATFISTTQLYDQSLLTVDKKVDEDGLEFRQVAFPVIKQPTETNMVDLATGTE